MGQVQGWRCWKLALVVSASLVVVSGCATAPEDQAMIESVVTALPQEVEGCTFVGNVDNDYISYTVQAARNNLRFKAAQLGANTLVETHLAVTPSMSYLYPDTWFGHGAWANTMNAPSFFLSGRAYRCPAGSPVRLFCRWCYSDVKLLYLMLVGFNDFKGELIKDDALIFMRDMT